MGIKVCRNIIVREETRAQDWARRHRSHIKQQGPTEVLPGLIERTAKKLFQGSIGNEACHPSLGAAQRQERGQGTLYMAD